MTLLEGTVRDSLDATLATRMCRAKESARPPYLGTWPVCRGVVVHLPLSTTFPEALDDVVCEGSTVRDVLGDFADRCRDLEPRIWNGDGGLGVTVSLNGVDMRELQGLATSVRDGDELAFCSPAAADPRLRRLLALQPLCEDDARDELERLRRTVVELSEEREKLSRVLALRQRRRA